MVNQLPIDAKGQVLQNNHPKCSQMTILQCFSRPSAARILKLVAPRASIAKVRLFEQVRP